MTVFVNILLWTALTLQTQYNYVQEFQIATPKERL